MKFACPVKGCSGTMVQLAALLCPKHWNELSPEQKSVIMKARKQSLAAERSAVRKVCEALEAE